MVSAQKFSLDQLSLLSGKWAGTSGTTQVEEYWSQPANGSMMGMYREMSHGQTTFYEFFTIEQEESGPVLRLKHFNAKLVGWEAKDQSVVWDVTSLGTDEITFISRDKIKPIKLTYKRSGEKLLGVLEREKDGKKVRDEFSYKRLD